MLPEVKPVTLPNEGMKGRNKNQFIPPKKNQNQDVRAVNRSTQNLAIPTWSHFLNDKSTPDGLYLYEVTPE